jgi:hypothetical protein
MAVFISFYNYLSVVLPAPLASYVFVFALAIIAVSLPVATFLYGVVQREEHREIWARLSAQRPGWASSRRPGLRFRSASKILKLNASRADIQIGGLLRRVRRLRRRGAPQFIKRAL